LRTYSYDDTDQLTGVTYSSSSTKNESYGYDKNGNRSGSQTHATTSGSFTGSSTVSNINQVSNDGKYTYLYDAEGNLTKRTETATSLVQEYTWDHRNRLTLATLKDASGVVTKTVEYRYDHANRLLQRIETPYTSGVAQTSSAVTTLFTYDGTREYAPKRTMSPLHRIGLRVLYRISTFLEPDGVVTYLYSLELNRGSNEYE
jgi:YD repeat-containing protein